MLVEDEQEVVYAGAPSNDEDINTKDDDRSTTSDLDDAAGAAATADDQQQQNNPPASLREEAGAAPPPSAFNSRLVSFLLIWSSCAYFATLVTVRLSLLLFLDLFCVLWPFIEHF